MHADTLEEDIVFIVNSHGHALSLANIGAQLAQEGVFVPETYLSRVVSRLVKIGYLKEALSEGILRYQPRSFWARFAFVWPVSLLRRALNVHYLSHHRMLLLLTMAALTQPMLEQSAFSEITPSESTEVLAPVQLHDDPDDESSLNPIHDPHDASNSPPVISPISTSRPSFTDAWTTVPKGGFQVENGATYTNNRGGTRAWTLPESLLRLGVTDNTELRFTVPNYLSLRDTRTGPLINNFGDISVGLSHHLKLPAKIELAVIPILNIPTGANNASSNAVDPQLRLAAARVMTPKLTLASMLDTRWNTSRNATADVVFNTTGIAYYAFTPKLCGFLEYSGFYPTSGPTTQFAQSGVLFLLAPRHQVDFRVAAGLNKNTPDFLVGFGYSFRIDGLLSRKPKRHERSTSR